MPSSLTDPGALVSAAVASSLDLASTWLAWDGRPLVTDGDNLWTPHGPAPHHRPPH